MLGIINTAMPPRNTMSLKFHF